jgi:hypothetical protein
MLVKELRELLADVPDDYPVEFWDNTRKRTRYFHSIKSVETVKNVTAENICVVSD